MISDLGWRKLPVVLESAVLNVEIGFNSAQVEVEQLFSNNNDKPIEVNFSFPIPDTAIVTSFEVLIDGKYLQGVLKDSAKSLEAYDDAISQGNTAFIGEKVGNSFSMSIGNFAPRSLATTRIKWTQELQTIPNVQNSVIFDFNSIKVAPKHGFLTKRVKVAARYLKDVQSSTHKLSISKSQDFWDIETNEIPRTDGTVVAFQLRLDLSEERKVDPMNLPFIEDNAIAGDAERYLLSYPITLPLEADLKNLQVLSSEAQEKKNVPSEYIFVVDCSGSMGGQPIKEANRAMMLFLQSLPAHSYFNIYRFGSNYQRLFETSALLSDQTLQQGRDYIQKTDANLGGTELLPPLQAIYASQVPQPNTLRNVFVLTDGQVGNTSTVVNIVAKNTARVFSFGIGAGVDTNLVEGIAKAGNGSCEYARDEKDRIQAKVLSQLKLAMLGVTVDGISVDIHVEYNSGKVVPCFESSQRCSFGSKLLLQMFADSIDLNTKEQSLGQVTITGVWKKVQYMLAKFPLKFENIYQGNFQHRVASSTLISVLERAINVDKAALRSGTQNIDTVKCRMEQNKQQIIARSIKYSVLTSYTSYILEQVNSEPIFETMELQVGLKTELDKFLVDPILLEYTKLRMEEERKITEEREAILQTLSCCGGGPSGTSDVEPLSIDLGSICSKSGWIGNDGPTCILGTVVGRPRHTGVMVGMGQKDAYVGGSVSFGSAKPSSGGATPAPVPAPSASAAPVSPLKPLSMPSTSSSSSNSNAKVNTTILDALLFSQTTSGAWTKAKLPELATAFGISSENILQESPAKDENSIQCWLTALVLVFLELQFATVKDEWELIATKGQQFLENSGNKNCIQVAKEFLHKFNVQ